MNIEKQILAENINKIKNKYTESTSNDSIGIGSYLLKPIKSNEYADEYFLGIDITDNFNSVEIEIFTPSDIWNPLFKNSIKYGKPVYKEIQSFLNSTGFKVIKPTFDPLELFDKLN